MNSDEIASLLRKIILAVAASTGGATFVSGNDAASIASGLVSIGTIAWGVYEHWNMKKVPENTVAIPVTKAS